MKSIDYPTDYGTVTEGGHCGVLAVSICAKRDFKTIWDFMSRRFDKSARWGGGTTHSQQIATLEAFGVGNLTTEHFSAQTLSDFKFLASDYVEKNYPRVLPRCTVATFAKKYAKADTTYLLNVGGHALTLLNGAVADQSGVGPVTGHWVRTKIVSRSTETHSGETS